MDFHFEASFIIIKWGVLKYDYKCLGVFECVWVCDMVRYLATAKFRASGAYIFRPLHQSPQIFFQRPNVTVYQGPISMEIHQEFSPWIRDHPYTTWTYF